MVKIMAEEDNDHSSAPNSTKINPDEPAVVCNTDLPGIDVNKNKKAPFPVLQLPVYIKRVFAIFHPPPGLSVHSFFSALHVATALTRG